MHDLTNRKELRNLFNKYDIKPKKSLGQNFITNRSVLLQAVQALDLAQDDIVIEIGPGLGALTRELCMAAKNVIAVEIDKRMVNIIQQLLGEYSNLEIINKDILKTDINGIINKYKLQQGSEDIKVKVVGNLPYYITTPIIMGLLEKQLPISQMVFMMQKEVAQRIVSEPGIKDYGVLSVMVQYYAIPSIITFIGPENFVPRPSVESALLKLVMRDKPEIDIASERIYFDVVKAAFNQRRKTLLNALSNSPKISVGRQQIENMLSDMDMSEKVRGENLSPHDFAKLSNAIYSLK